MRSSSSHTNMALKRLHVAKNSSLTTSAMTHYVNFLVTISREKQKKTSSSKKSSKPQIARQHQRTISHCQVPHTAPHHYRHSRPDRNSLITARRGAANWRDQECHVTSNFVQFHVHVASRSQKSLHHRHLPPNNQDLKRLKEILCIVHVEWWFL